MPFRVATVLVLTTLMTSGALAAAPKKLGDFAAWSAWSYAEAENKGCFIYANPASASPKTLDHGLVSFFIRSTHRKDVRTEASLQFGYEQASKADAEIKIDGEAFQLMTDGVNAWLARGREAEMIEAMRTGRAMEVSTVSKRGNKTAYAFPLKGVTDAMKVLRKTCP